MCVALLIILTVGHFVVVWSIYLERKFEMVGKRTTILIVLKLLVPKCVDGSRTTSYVLCCSKKYLIPEGKKRRKEERD